MSCATTQSVQAKILHATFSLAAAQTLLRGRFVAGTSAVSLECSSRTSPLCFQSRALHIRRYPEPSQSLAFSPDGGTLAVMDNDEAVHL